MQKNNGSSMTVMAPLPSKPVIPPGRFCRIVGGFADNAKQETKREAKRQAKHITRRVRKTVLIFYRDFIMRLSEAHGVVRGRKAIWSFIETERQMQE